MKFQEALESGRPFRCSDFVSGWYWWAEGGELVYGPYPKKSKSSDTPLSGDAERPFLEYLLRDDWKILEEPIQLTKTQFWDAVREALKAREGSKEFRFSRNLYELEVITDVASKLGLKYD